MLFRCYITWSAHSVMIIIAENGYGEQNSNPAPGGLHFT